MSASIVSGSNFLMSLSAVICFRLIATSVEMDVLLELLPQSLKPYLHSFLQSQLHVIQFLVKSPTDPFDEPAKLLAEPAQIEIHFLVKLPHLSLQLPSEPIHLLVQG